MGHSYSLLRVAHPVILALCFAASWATPATAESTSTHLRLAGASATAPYGTSPMLIGIVQVQGVAGPLPPAERPGGLVNIRVDGRAAHTQPVTFLGCENGENALAFAVERDLFPLGEHTVVAEYAGDARFVGSVSAPFTIKVTPQFSGSATAQSGTFEVGLAWDDPLDRVTCRFNGTGLTAASGVPAQPLNTLEFPYGYFRYDISGCTPSAPAGLRQRLAMKTAAALPAGATVWAYGPRSAGAFPEWYEVPANFDATSATVFIQDGGNGDQTSLGDGMIQGLIAIAIPKVPHVAFEVEGLWWAGAQENGWGMTIARHDDRLFNALFIYGDDGSSQWVVMPGGSWNADFTVFTGNLYIPSGSPFDAYDASRLVVGAPVGSATLTFTSANAGSLAYSIRGATGTKAIQRQMFGEGQHSVMDVDGLWWGGTFQSGWGFAINQQDNTLFNVWYTYDAAGTVSWYVMPGGTWVTPRVYAGTLYRTRSSPWIGRPYNPGALSVTAVGTMSVAFDNANDATLTYTVNGVTQSRSITRQPF